MDWSVDDQKCACDCWKIKMHSLHFDWYFCMVSWVQINSRNGAQSIDSYL